MIAILEFFDVAFFRLFWALLIDYLIASGYLLPEQRQQWVEGYSHIIGVMGAVIFIAIWQYHSHKKDLATGTTTVSTPSLFGRVFTFVLNKVVVKKPIEPQQ